MIGKALNVELIAHVLLEHTPTAHFSIYAEVGNNLFARVGEWITEQNRHYL